MLSVSKTKGLLAGLILFCGGVVWTIGQTPAKRVVQIDNSKLAEVIKPAGKPLLINFWATWCEPCREEFPDLVKLEIEYKGKIDVITISLDDLAEIDRDVPKFLASMKAEMPAYLLKTDDENAAIKMVSKDWTGNLPLTVLIDAKGTTAYQRNGKFKYETLKENMDRVLGTVSLGTGVIETIDFIKVKDGRRDDARYYYENNWRAYRAAAVKRGLIHSFDYVEITIEKDSAFDLLLITRYQGEEQYNNREKIFEPIIKELSPNGPFMRGTSKPDDFRQIVYAYTGKSIFSAAK